LIRQIGKRASPLNQDEFRLERWRNRVHLGREVLFDLLERARCKEFNEHIDKRGWRPWFSKATASEEPWIFYRTRQVFCVNG
jgi:hypothetical protein